MEVCVDAWRTVEECARVWKCVPANGSAEKYVEACGGVQGCHPRGAACNLPNTALLPRVSQGKRRDIYGFSGWIATSEQMPRNNYAVTLNSVRECGMYYVYIVF